MYVKIYSCSVIWGLHRGVFSFSFESQTKKLWAYKNGLLVVLHFLEIPENEEHVWQQMSDVINPAGTVGLWCFKGLGCSMIHLVCPETSSVQNECTDRKLWSSKRG